VDFCCHADGSAFQVFGSIVGKALAEASGNVRKNWIGLLDTAAQYYLKKDVSALSDGEWCEVIAQVLWIRTKEKEESLKFNYRI
jgi:hypothetical protein